MSLTACDGCCLICGTLTGLLMFALSGTLLIVYQISAAATSFLLILLYISASSSLFLSSPSHHLFTVRESMGFTQTR